VDEHARTTGTRSTRWSKTSEAVMVDAHSACVLSLSFITIIRRREEKKSKAAMNEAH